MRRLLLVLVACVLSFSARAKDEEEHPLRPADISSPRATLSSFVESCSVAYQILQSEGRELDSAQSREEVQRAVRAIQRCMDTRNIAEFRRDNMTKEAAVSLKEVLDRIELPKERDIPDRDDIVLEDGSKMKRWTVPNTEITFELIEEGPLEGSYQFSEQTVLRAQEFLERVRHLPYKEGATEGFAATYLSSPGTDWLARVVQRLPASMLERKAEQAVWQWVGTGVVLLISFVLMAALYTTGRRVSRKDGESSLLRSTLTLVFPIAAAFIPARAAAVIQEDLVVSGQPLYFIKFNLSLLTLFASTIVVLGVGRRVGEVIAAVPHIKASSIDAQLARLMSRLLGMVVAMVLLLQGGQHLGIPLSSLLAGAGVVGAALALSAQDVLKNIFGSIMIIMDKPYAVGERIRIKTYDGVIEEIGLRSTKIRLLNGHQAVIPNEDMARSDIENIGRRPFIRRVSSIRLPVDIPAEKAEEAVKTIEEILKDHEGMTPEFPPRAWLSEFGSDHLELKMIYWYHPPNYWDFTAHADRVNREILSRFRKAGLSIALPAFTTRAEDESGAVISG
ncbi:mechanosensitive ion channel family protein [Pontiella sp.]|uniref:mechanosensitive ion channel family protein n=1 Tax=Pontiella sp. TaxID=2837462 RepID=UPI003569E5F4